MGEVGRPPLAVTFHAVVNRLTFAASIGEPVARRDDYGRTPLGQGLSGPPLRSL